MGRHPEKYSQADRLARMMRVLASRRATVPELVQELGVSRRQVYRDLERIEQEGHPLTHEDSGEDKSWQLPLGYKGLPQITISPYELMSLYLAKSSLAHLHGTPFMEDLDNVLGKITSSLPAKTVNHLERIVQSFLPLQRPTRGYETKKEVLASLRRALLLQRTVVLNHQRPDHDKPVPHQMDPYVLVSCPA